MRDLPDQVTSYVPGRRFPSISVTGSECSVGCTHCKGRYLHGMRPAGSPEELLTFALELDSNGGTGILLSGGCLPDGSVPIGPFLGAVREIVSRTSLMINLHPGIIDEGAADAIAGSGAHVASMDLIGSRSTVKEVLGMDWGTEDQLRSIKLLQEWDVPVVPHITIGLHNGRILGEHDALETACSLGGDVLVLNMLIPQEDMTAPSPADVLAFVEAAVSTFNGRVVLGCMRTRDPEIELAVLRLGVRGIVNPTTATKRVLDEEGVEVDVVEGCCAMAVLKGP